MCIRRYFDVSIRLAIVWSYSEKHSWTHLENVPGGTCLPLHWQSSNSCDNNDIYFIGITILFHHEGKKLEIL